MADIPKDNVIITSYDAFYNQMYGNGVDVDGYYGYQCWDACAVLWYKRGWTLYTGPQGIAYECWSVSRDRNTHTPTITQVTERSSIKRGDILVFAPYTSGFLDAGHIAYANEDYDGSGNIDIFGQNQGAGSNPVTGKPFNVINVSISGFVGGFRYDAWQEPVPPTPTETKKKREFPYPVAWNNWYGFEK